MISEVAPKNWSNLGMLLSLSRPQFPVKKRGVPGLVTTAATKDVAALVRCSAQCAHVVTAQEIAPAFVFREIVVNDYSQGRRTAPSPSSACTRGPPGFQAGSWWAQECSRFRKGSKVAVGRERGL